MTNLLLDSFLHWPHVLASVVYSFVGIILLIIAFWVVEMITPENIWKEVSQNKNVALAIVIASFILGISLIIASAIHE